MKNNKGFVIPFLLGITAFLVVGVGIYFYYNNKEVQTSIADSIKVESVEEVKIKIDSIYKNLYIGEIFKSGFAYIEPFNVDRDAFGNKPVEVTNYPEVIKIYPIVKNINNFFDAVFNAKFNSYVPNIESEDSIYFYQCS